MTSPLLSASTARVSVKLLAPFVSAAQQLGMHVERALAAVGLSQLDLENPELRVSHAALDHMLRDAQARSGVRDLGLLAAERLSPEHLDVVEYAARSQPTLRAGLEHAMRYYALLHDAFKAHIEVAGDTAVLHVSFGGLPVDAGIYEFVLAAHVLSVRRMTGLLHAAPLETHFVHVRPKSALLHERIFQSQLHFGRPHYALVFARSLLDTPLLAADEGLAGVLERHAARALQKLGNRAGLVARVSEIVREDLSSGKLSADNISRRLGMSTRTLHRRLRVENSSYRVVVDAVRREIALHSLRDRELSIVEVGYSLGFTTGPAFHRAFRRWTGTSVAALRSEFLKARNENV
jgi:AraC-like DNA-binding protein